VRGQDGPKEVIVKSMQWKSDLVATNWLHQLSEGEPFTSAKITAHCPSNNLTNMYGSIILNCCDYCILKSHGLLKLQTGLRPNGCESR